MSEPAHRQPSGAAAPRFSGAWIHHFPYHLSWSNATLVCKAMAPYGAVALGEIDRIGEALRGHEGDADKWQSSWYIMGAEREALGDAASAAGHTKTAAHFYLRAGNYYYTGERMVPPGPVKTAIYEKALRCYQAGLAGRHPNIERVEVPCEGGSLPALFMRSPHADGPAPTVVVFDGLDNCKEMSILFAGLEFAERGFHTLSVDGPGQGEALRLRGIPYRHDYEVPGAAAFDYLATRNDVDRAKVVVLGYSFGGYCAPRIAGYEPRYAACVAFGAMYWDMTEWLSNKYRIAEDKAKNTTNSFQVGWTLGTQTKEEAFAKIAKFSLVDAVKRMKCPLLVVHGEEDRIVPLEAARKLYEESASPVKRLKFFSAEDGGAEHCQVDDRQAGVDYIADWIGDTLVGKGWRNP